MVAYAFKDRPVETGSSPWRGILWTIFLVGLLFPPIGHTQQGKAVAVLPFSINAPESLDHLRLGLQEILSTRLADLGISMVPPNLVNRHPLSSLPALGLEEVSALGQALQVDFLVLGSLTQIGRTISLDVKTQDVKGAQPPFSIFMVEEDIERLPEAVERVSKSLYNRIAGIAQIDSVQVRGNRRVESEAVLAVVESKKGESLDDDKLDRDLRAIFAMGYFTDVAIQTQEGPSGAIVTFNVTEKPSIGSITFKGNKKIKSDDLSKEAGIKLYSIFNPADIRQSVNRIRDLYLKKGYYNTEITEKIEDLPGNEVALIYEIEEGKKFHIRHIEFVGNTAFSDRALTKVMETREKWIFSWITKSGLLDEKKLETDLQRITLFYNNQGYIRAKAGDPKITYKDEGDLIITIQIVEGERYTLNNVTVEGDLIEPEEDLLKRVSIGKEKHFSREGVRRDVLALRSVYSNQGYAYADVVPIVNEDDKNHQVDIAYRITSGGTVRFERINIYGNSVTRDKVIRRELDVIEGEYFTGIGLTKSTERLQRLGYFEDLEIQTKKGSRDDLMIVDINVKEQPTGSFSLGAGYSGYEGAVGLLQVSQSNLFGRGQMLAASVRASTKTTHFNVRFTEPWLFDRRLSAGIDLYKWEQDLDDYTRDSYGGAIRFKVPTGFDEYTWATAKYLYDNSTITDVAATAAFPVREMLGDNLTSSITLGMERDSKDRPWNTSRGSENKLTVEYAGGFLGGDVYFNRYELTSAWFFPLFWDTNFMVQGKWGYVKQRTGGKLPDYQKYRIGGIHSVRGYDWYDITLIDPPTGEPIGGEKMMMYNLEYRFPLVKEQGVVGVLFFDAGNVFGKDDNFSFKNIPRSIGAGVRWYSPFGPIRIEYGYILNRRPDDPTGNVEFSIGGFF
jgi:outer membrane protein insertion porin family